MLKSLYDYAVRSGLTLPPGYSNKTVKAYVVLSSRAEDFAQIVLGDDIPLSAPDIGSLANGTDKSNVLLEKRSIVFPEEPSAKGEFFLASLKDAAACEPLLLPCVRAIESPELAKRIREMLEQNKVKAGDRITFQVDHQNVLGSVAIQAWWAEYRRRFQPAPTEEQTRCMITGELTVPMRTVGKVSGLRAVGGHSSGDALVCFDKAAFESYDLKQAANASVSEEAMSAVNNALTILLKKAPTLAGMKIVHWYDCDLPPQDDPLSLIFGTFSENAETDSEDTGQEEEKKSPADEGEKGKARRAEKDFRDLVESVHSGKNAVPLQAQYHILMLSGAGGRVMIRRYARGSYVELVDALAQWEEELRLTNSLGTGVLPPVKLAARMIRLLKYQKNDRDIFQRMGKELSALGPAVLHAILNGRARIPDDVPVRALHFIRSKMMSSEEDDQGRDHLDSIAIQWLKVWLIRNRNKGGSIMDSFNPAYYSVPYQCGAMVAVYGAIQYTAMGEVNASVIDRYYGAAIQTPALVMGTLSQKAMNHLSSMKTPVRLYYERLLAELSEKMRDMHIPKTLNLEQQSEFAVGYFQMKARMNRERMEKAAARQAAEAKKEDQ